MTEPSRSRSVTTAWRLLAGAGLALAVGGSAAAQSAIEPGAWEMINRIVSPAPVRKVEKRCIAPQDVAKFMLGPSNHIYRCTYPVQEIGDGKIRLEGSCATKHGQPVPVSGVGQYSRETYHIDVRLRPKIAGLTVPVHMASDGRRLSAECQAPAPR
jgi:hypothetical protein